MRNVFKTDNSKDAKLYILENAISVVDKNKQSLGKMKNLSSLEKNRMALNMISTLKAKEKTEHIFDQKKLSREERNTKGLFSEEYNRINRMSFSKTN